MAKYQKRIRRVKGAKLTKSTVSSSKRNIHSENITVQKDGGIFFDSSLIMDAPKGRSYTVLENKIERLEMRVTAKHKSLFVKASGLRGFKNVSDYLQHIALEDAAKVIEDSGTLKLNIEAQKVFFDALSRDAAPNEYLKKSMKEYLTHYVSGK